MSKEIVFIPAHKKFDNELTDTITRKKKVCVYARVSTDELDQENSYSTQISEYTKIIQENPEWEFAGIYADKGFSGTSINAREQFKQMIDDCYKGKIDLILTKSISRFSRNTVDCLNIVRELRNHKIEIFFEKENLYSSDNKIDLLLSILTSVAQEEACGFPFSSYCQQSFQ
ncbi:MAG: recombinase family protein [Bacilli bacterium]